jgi:hypothetical protein
MAKKITQDAIIAKQQELIKETQDLSKLDDGEEIVERSKKLQEKGAQLQAMVLVFEAQQHADLGLDAPDRERPWEPSQPSGRVKVQLTDEQRKNVHQETGVWMDVVEFVQGDELRREGMPTEDLEVIEARAIQKANRQKKKEGSAQAVSQGAAESMAAIAKGDDPDLKAALEKATKDPSFLGGTFYKS